MNSLRCNEARIVNASQVGDDDGYDQPSIEELEDLMMFSSQTHQSYGTIIPESVNFSLTRSFLRSLFTAFTIKLAMFPLGILIVASLYLDLNSSQLCFEQMRRPGNFSVDIMKWRLIGDGIETLAIHLWFPFTLGILFGWSEFKTNYMFTVYTAIAFGVIVVTYKILLFIFHIFQTKQYYSYFGNLLFLLEVLCCSYFVARKVRKIHLNVALSKLQIVIIISTEFITGFIIGMAYRYYIVVWFNGMEDEIKKAMVAVITPLYAVIPVAVCKRLASICSAITDPGRTFVLVYLLQGVITILYRTMQADVKNIWIFIGMSVLHALFGVAKKAKKHFRDKILACLIQCLNRICCCRRQDRRVFHDTPNQRRLQADLDIQYMLYEYTAIILSQIYQALYLITNFEVSSWPILEVALLRIAIAVGIDFFFNSICIFIQMHWYKNTIREVWLKNWKLHMLANAFVAAMTIWYFSPVLLEVVRVHTNTSGRLNLTNCTGPFQEMLRRFSR